MGVFSSDYQNTMFEPFIQDFLNDLKNPYQSFYERGETINFPYPPVMLLIMSLSKSICMLMPDIPFVLHRIIFKLPLLGMDCLLFANLCAIYPDKKMKVVWIYFASPIIIYATYMHTQLDIIPTGFLFIALLYLTGINGSEKLYLSAVFLTLALLSKFHIAAILPLIAIYLYKHTGFKKTLNYFGVVTLILAAGIIPFYGEGFISGVMFNTAQSALFALYFSYGSLRLYLSFMMLIVIYLYIMNLNFINNELLFGLGGLIFSSFLVLCAPMPGWYLWIMLFMADFVIRSNGYHYCGLYYFVLQILYLIFFLFLHTSQSDVVDLYYLETDCSFLKINIDVIKNTSFTLLSAVMLYLVYLMHKYCIKGNGIYQFHNSAFVIGICGDSGTGKSTLQNCICQMFSDNNFLCLEGDGDHKWERGDNNWKTYTHLNPQANYLYRQAVDIQKLKNGETIQRVDYDHDTGRFTSKMTVRPRRFLSISGLHIFYLPQLRNIVDLKIYTEADEDLRIFWKMERDTGKRGHTRDEILKQIRSRYDDARKYIYPQKEFADIIVHYFWADEEARIIGMKIKVNTKIDMEAVISTLKNFGADISYEFSEDFRYQIIIYHPEKNSEFEKADFNRVFNAAFPNGNDVISQKFSSEDASDCIRKLILVQSIRAKLFQCVNNF